MKLANILLKGATTAARVAAGSFAFGAASALANWHPTGTAALIWYGGGVTAATGVLAMIERWAKFDPSKVK